MLKDGRFTVYSISLIPFVTRGHELPAAVQKDWTADQNFPRSLILFETVKHFLTFFFSTTKPDSVILYATQTDIAEESFHVHVVIFDEMLQGNTVENTCEMSNSIGFLVGKNFRSLKWFMTKKYKHCITNIYWNKELLRTLNCVLRIIKVRIGLYGGSQDKRSCFQKPQWL